ncbi:MAG TPA: cation transporter [Roseiflexaceae bacterium]|nr:cation transporter [Roseiflexaceae bacterium]
MTDRPLERMTFAVPHMDCAAEEQLVRMKLADQEQVKHLAFDLLGRTVVVIHAGDGAAIEQALRDLNLGASLTAREAVDDEEIDLDANNAQQRKLLIIVLLINAGLFVLEVITGFLANSMGLVADSLDMLADALVYGLSLYAVGKAVATKKHVARASGYFQLLLAVFGIVEVLRRFFDGGEETSFTLMIVISLLALAGNAASLVVLRRTQSEDANIKASQIFTSNDVLVNIGVIVAGVLVFFTSSNTPDLVVGAVVFCLVASGAFRILQLSK